MIVGASVQRPLSSRPNHVAERWIARDWNANRRQMPGAFCDQMGPLWIVSPGPFSSRLCCGMTIHETQLMRDGTGVRRWRTRVQNGAKVEGKMKGSVLLVSEKRVCTGVETARHSKARAVIKPRLREPLAFARAVFAVARWSTPEGAR